MKTKYAEFILRWESFAEIWAGLFMFLALTILLFYVIGLFVAKNRTSLYDYVSSHEIPAFLNVMIFASLSLTLYVNSMLIGEYRTMNDFALVVQSFGSLVIGVLFWYVTRMVIKIYYPYILNKHLAKIRFKPRYSRETGNPMKLLTEDEEDVHLTEEQIAHEEIFAFDYDVWIDIETGDKMIEKYDTHHTNIVCPKCNFRTLRELKEIVVKEPTVDTDGQLEKHYKCDNCEHREVVQKNIVPLSENV